MNGHQPIRDQYFLIRSVAVNPNHPNIPLFSLPKTQFSHLILLSRGGLIFCKNKSIHHIQQPTGPSKQPIRTLYLSHVTGLQPIREQYFLVRSVAGHIIFKLYHTHKKGVYIVLCIHCETTPLPQRFKGKGSCCNKTPLPRDRDSRLSKGGRYVNFGFVQHILFILCVSPQTPLSILLTQSLSFCVFNTRSLSLYQQPTDTSKQPITARYLGHVTGYQPIRSVPALKVSLIPLFQLVTEPIQSLVETVSTGRTGSLNVPVPVSKGVETELVSHFRGVHCVG